MTGCNSYTCAVGKHSKYRKVYVCNLLQCSIVSLLKNEYKHDANDGF